MGWNAYSKYVTLKQTPTGIFVFKFPNKDGVHYLMRECDGIKGKKIGMSFEIKGNNPVFTAPGEPPARVRLFFQRKGDDGLGGSETQWYRWWSQPVAADLRVGKQKIAAALSPNQWQSVWGKLGTVNTEKFFQAIEQAEYVGMTFGSASQFGHGAWLASGTAKFKLLQFSY